MLKKWVLSTHIPKIFAARFARPVLFMFFTSFGGSFSNFWGKSGKKSTSFHTSLWWRKMVPHPCPPSKIFLPLPWKNPVHIPVIQGCAQGGGGKWGIAPSLKLDHKKCSPEKFPRKTLKYAPKRGFEHSYSKNFTLFWSSVSNFWVRWSGKKCHVSTFL